MKKHLGLCLLLTFLFVSSHSFSQTAATASITGTVTDPQRAVVPNATVIARNEATGVERRTTTTSEGLYNFPTLPVGTYDIRAESGNFNKSEVKGVKLQVGDR